MMVKRKKIIFFSPCEASDFRGRTGTDFLHDLRLPLKNFEQEQYKLMKPNRSRKVDQLELLDRVLDQILDQILDQTRLSSQCLLVKPTPTVSFKTRLSVSR